MINSFPCTNCGVCCKNIGGIKELKSFDLGNGICKYLDTQSNLCRIYQNRPDICRVDVMFERVYFKHYTKEAFYKLNMQSCKILQERVHRLRSLESHLDSKYKDKQKETRCHYH